MNQQRSRRFRASKESWEKQQEVNNIKEELLEKGACLPEEKNKGFHFDSNCITPVSTQFCGDTVNKPCLNIETTKILYLG